MGKDKKWIHERKHDLYYRKAKSEHYSSRAAYKIIQLDKKYHILPPSGWVLDLCCAPGSWMEAVTTRQPQLHVVGIDLNPVQARASQISFTRGDILSDEVIGEALRKVKKEPPIFNVIISDCAPKFSGIKEIDLYKQHELSMRVVELCRRYLVTGGHCVIKYFQGNSMDQQELEKNIRDAFKHLYRTKPDSSRKKSAEFYYVCMERK
ncbi:hypothetical protein GF325_15850 [Candidatus Bathyarchaeota archaeon]|nr:hypothetical protein [Candidatus Bathyarchaeota archaeon]